MASKTTTRHTGRAAILDEMRARGLVHKSATGDESVTPGLEALLSEEHVTGYIGFDPTADSLHAGNLVPIMLLVHLQRHGHRPIGIVGGGTGLIGDPGGRSSERPILSREEAEANLQGIRRQLEKFLDFEAGSNSAMLINNADWLDGMNLLDFLRDVGKHFTINYMQAKESVRLRMEQEEGISFTEFSYPLLQAFDFLTLYDRYGCKLQMGGSDQWGNLTTGVELLRRVKGVQAHVLAAPLLLTATGEKFGKSVGGGSVWLDPNKTSPFRFYQYWFNTDDRDVGKFLRLFTLISTLRRSMNWSVQPLRSRRKGRRNAGLPPRSLEWSTAKRHCREQSGRPRCCSAATWPASAPKRFPRSWRTRRISLFPGNGLKAKACDSKT